METCCYLKNKGNIDETENNEKAKNRKRLKKSCRPIRSSSNIRTHEGWKFQWTEPKSNFVKTVVPGPFAYPRLIRALPYVVVSKCDDCSYNNDPVSKLRIGIPDPWQEYLTWKDSSVSGHDDVRLRQEYLRFTDYVWNEKGLAMVQGIPDPWKIDIFCKCEKIPRRKVKKKKRKKSEAKNLIKDEMEKIVREIPDLINSDKINEEVEKVSGKAMENLENMNGFGKIKQQLKENLNGFDKVKQKLTEVENDLKLKEVLNEQRKQEIEKRAKLKKKEPRKANKKNKKSGEDYEIVYCTNKPFGTVPIAIKKESSRRKSNKDSIKDYVDKRIQNSVTACVKEEVTKQIQKVDKGKRKKHSVSPNRSSDGSSSCAGACGRISRNNKKVHNYDNSKNSCGSLSPHNSDISPAKTPIRAAHLKEFLNEINSRIEITKNVLNSPDLKTEQVIDISDKLPKKKSKERGLENTLKKSLSQECERGAGDQEMSRRELDLFFRTKCNENSEEDNEDDMSKGNNEKVSKYFKKTSSNFEVSQIPGAIVGREPCYLKYCYQKSSVQNFSSVTNENDDEIIVQSFTDTE